jgi:hypothetical protein
MDVEALFGIGGAVLAVYGDEIGEIFGGLVEHDLVDSEAKERASEH